MHAYQLSSGVHFCEIGDQRVFLDLAGDRYFSLPCPADTAFALLVTPATGEAPSSFDIEFLLRAGVLVDAPHGKPIEATRHERPTSSLVEEGSIGAKFTPQALLEAWLLVHRAVRRISTKRLPGLLEAVSNNRPAEGSARAVRDRAVSRFLTVRRYIPIAPNCLHDSLALCRFLQRRGIASDLVIGAKLHPFGAHCWVQDGPTVLNDTLAAARGFQPVLVA